MAQEVETQPSSTTHCLNTECANKSHNDSRITKVLKLLISNKEEELRYEKHTIQELESTNFNIKDQSRRIKHEANFATAFANELKILIEIADTASEELKVQLGAGTADPQALQEQFANLQTEVFTSRSRNQSIEREI